MARFSISELMEAGFHFGHQTKRWNPKMERYIFTSRNKVHIIDLQQSVALLRNAYNEVREVVSRGGKVLFVGTKRQVVDMISQEAQRCNQFFVNHRWLGGTLTNWQTINGSIRRLKEIEKMKEDGTFESRTKKEIQGMERDRLKMERALGGIKDMEGPPQLLIVVDTNRESIAVREANKLGIPVVALVDTNCDPDPVQWVVPGNDDAIRSLGLFLGKMADAVLEGQNRDGDAAMASAMAQRPGPGAEEMVVEDKDAPSPAE
ncbi:MAG: 30S ribosomal protein S2 [Magnetococcales bacterium]|nr:30S ribosomal protein S2 [Magnetococcales bacterium]